MEENSLNRHGTGEILGILRLRLSRTAPSASLRMTRGKKSLKRKEPQPFAGKFKLHDFVVMPDHFHVLLTVDGNTSIERAIQLIKGGYSFRRNKELGLAGEIWPPDFPKSGYRTERVTWHKKYIDENPVKAGLAKSAEEYPYCSAYFRKKKKASG